MYNKAELFSNSGLTQEVLHSGTPPPPSWVRACKKLENSKHLGVKRFHISQYLIGCHTTKCYKPYTNIRTTVLEQTLR
jgi:hypothetical protein